ncbi:NAD(P)-dependent oxidoreductase [Actinomadura verrucosospora]|uniref:2-hydroxy-3-oxopropionate reductase n=1 Tax=Actinomadura verrucosospora TaxID=46165 RepID=A0A7D3ZSW3_ACTVE|nr:NAD(P)-dependent oxidoreductase [Actinomadura verrucosospora]QKG26923.1 2-hydroxy-3-oxopropionate reductase [Actinomadura verrucosospora]
MGGTLRVGFVGLGEIGKPMATRLAGRQAEAKLDLTVFDLAAAPVEELVAAGAKAAASVGALAAGSDVLCVMVNNDQQVRSVLDEALAALGDRDGGGNGLTVVIHSTVAPGTAAELQELAARRGVRLVDAPVSGGAMGAGTGELAVLVGGSDEAFAAIRPVMDVLAKKVVHAGPIGAGTRFKLARNLMHYAAFTAATEAQRLAEAAGLDLVELGEVVRHTDALTGGPGAIMYRDTAAEMEPGSFWFTTFGHLRQLAEKDLDFAIALADELGVEVPMARLARERLAPGLGFPEEQE